MSELRQRKAGAGVSAGSEMDKPKSDTSSRRGAQFATGLWTFLAIQNWLLDFGRPFGMIYLDKIIGAPLNLPSVGDYFHMAYNVFTPFLVARLLDRCPRKVPGWLKDLCVIFFVMGASIHLVGDSVDTRLVHAGYDLSKTVKENPIMQQLQPSILVNFFELLYFYDEVLGHWMWYVPFFVAMLAFQWGSYVPLQPRQRTTSIPAIGWMFVMPISAVYYFYLVVEGQIFPLFAGFFILLILLHISQGASGKRPDANALFNLLTFLSVMVMVGAWSAWLWDDPELTDKIPEVWELFQKRGLF